MTSWIRQALRSGLLTTRFPKVAASAEELPDTGRPPRPGPGGDRGRAPSLPVACPTGAIRPEGIDQGRCIRCARCRSGGFVPSGGAEANVGDRAGLFWPDGEGPPPAGPRPSPLRLLGRSLALFLIDVGSCQACFGEVQALASPYYDLSRLGMSFTNSPRHADLLVVVGIPTAAMVAPLRRTYAALPGPKAVLAVGACAIDGGIFRESSQPSVAELVPVDLFVAGCPPPPVAVLAGILELTGRMARPEVPP